MTKFTDETEVGKLVSCIEYLLDYSRRVAQRQVLRNDPFILAEIREMIKEIKGREDGKE